MQHSFEFDEAKSCSNKSKHGIAFLEAQALWLGSDLLRLTANCETEPQYLFIGKAGAGTGRDRHLSRREHQAHLGQKVPPTGG